MYKNKAFAKLKYHLSTVFRFTVFNTARKWMSLSKYVKLFYSAKQ